MSLMYELNFFFIYFTLHHFAIVSYWIFNAFILQVCELFGIEAQAQDINMRQYKLTVHEEYDPTRLFTGEIARLNSLKVCFIHLVKECLFLCILHASR